jgi:threonine aldolase
VSAAAVVDLRSDTVTRPTPAMRQAMAAAEVGDDVLGEDPSVRRLEEEAAERLGCEASLFVPSGTMGNQIAIHLQTRPGTDVLLEADSHVYRHELGAMAAWSGALPRVLAGRAGRLQPADVAGAVAPSDVYYLARASLLVLENSHNYAGGTVLPVALQAGLVAAARARGLRAHLDGARLFNAACALGCRPAALAAGFDSVMFCLSKGLGAPVGSLLCGSAELVREGRVVRKRMGGGMRQAGVLAAAGSHALAHHVERLAEDHRRAARLAEALTASAAFVLDPETVQTNIVIAALRRPEDESTWLERLRQQGVLAAPMGPGRLRFVTHLDVDDAGLERAMRVIRMVDA